MVIIYIQPYTDHFFNMNVSVTASNAENAKLNKKPNKKLRIIKMFRLFDFQTFDGTHVEDSATESSSSDNDSDNGYKNKKKPSAEKVFTIQMFGANEKGETCCIYITEYKPFFYVKVGDKWGQKETDALIREIKSKVGNPYQNAILSYELVSKHKLYGFSGGKKCNFVKIVFQNMMTMNRVLRLWYAYNSNPEENDGEYRKRIKFYFMNVSIELYESNIPPLLRYFHIQNISPSGWVSFYADRVVRVMDKKTTCNFEYICPLAELKPMNDKETRIPYKICSFDIEASSSHGDFPVPVKTYKKLAKNLVDMFLLQRPFLNDTKSLALLERVVLTAFGYSSCDNVDIVYPKYQPNKQTVKSWIQKLHKHSIVDVKKELTDDGNKAHLLTIDNIFDNMNNTAAENMSGKGYIDDEDGEDDTEDDKFDREADVEPHMGAAVAKTASSSSISKDIKKTSTVIDILMSSDHSPDEKIQIVNDILTRIFPELEGDKVTMIGSTFLRYGEQEPYMNHCVVLGSCDDVPGAVIESAKTEEELLLKWTELIQEENPDIIIGYNIFGFDYEFLFRRAQENRCERQFLLLSRKQNELCANENHKEPNPAKALSIMNTKVSLASGEYDLRYIQMSGRLQIDLLAYFRRNENLSSYKLDDVAGYFISDDVKKIVHTNIDNTDVTELYTQNIMGLHAGDFIHIAITSFTTDYYKNGKKFVVLDIQYGREVVETVKGKEVTNKYNVIIIGHHQHIDMTKSIKWGMAKDDINYKDIFKLSNGSSKDRALVAKYCIQDCNLVQHLMNKVDVMTGFVEMSSICSVPISFLVFRGQGIKLTSFVAKKCRDYDTLMPDLEKTKYNDGYEGAIVLPPKCAMYMDNPVACVDYSSLYPSSMISQNFSQDSKVWTKEYNLAGKLIGETGERDGNGCYIYDNMPGYQYIDIEFDTFRYIRNPERPKSKAVKTKVGKMVVRWAQLPKNEKSIMPSILMELLKARSDTRKKIKSESDPFMQNVLDKRQLGYKVTANSLYGQCGSSTSTFYDKDVAACTTATGRMMITYAKRMIEEVYGNLVYETEVHGPVKCKAEYVYGDTDSVFFTFNLENPLTGEKIRGKPALEMTIEIAQDAAKLCTHYLKPPMELSYEKTLMPFILLSKKRYVGMLYETDPNKGKLKYMGLPLKRRDNCDYLKDVYGGILNILMKEGNMKKAIDFLNECLQNLTQGKVPIDKLTITKQLRSYYANPQQIGHFVLAERMGKRDAGNKPKSGDRVKFAFIVNDTPKALMGDKIETPEYILENNIPLDYTHYITNQLMKPLQQLLGLALEKIWEIKGQTVAIKRHRMEINELMKEEDDFEKFIKKREKFCSKKVEGLLFREILNTIYNEKHGIQRITSFFSQSASNN